MILHLKENIFSKLFLTESSNSKKAHRDTRQILARVLNRTVDDPMVIQSEQAFEKEVFGEGLRTDWFITLEPYAAKWVYLQNYPLPKVKSTLSYIAAKASSVQDRTTFMQQVKAIDDFGDLWFFIEKCKKEDRKFARDNRNETQALNQNYDVLGPLSFEESAKYGNETGGNGESCKICYTQYPNTWKSSDYSNDDKNNLFILLRKDWKSVSPQHDGSEADNGLGEPYNTLTGYDDYGLSMVFVWLTPEGELHESNTRWNHGGSFISPNVDKAFTEDSIQKLMGAPFESIFNVDSMYEKLDTVDERLANGESIDSICDEVKEIYAYLYLLRIGEKYNLYRYHFGLVFGDYWANSIVRLNEIGDLYCDFGGRGYVYTSEKNLMSFDAYIDVLQERIQNGTELASLFPNRVTISSNYTMVSFDQNTLGDISACNIITSDGIFLSNKWQKRAKVNSSSINNCVEVILGDKMNILKNGDTFLFDVPYEDWYSRIEYSENNNVFVAAKLGKGITIIGQDLSPLTDEWYSRVTNINNKEGFCTVVFMDGHWGYVGLYDGRTLGKDMGVMACNDFGRNVRGCGEVTLERDFGRNYFLTKDNELFDYDDYIEYLRNTSFVKLANGENIEDVFSNYKVIGENVFVNIRDNDWNMLNKERNDFVFPFKIKEPREFSDFALIKVQYEDYYDRFNVVYPNGEIALNSHVDEWADNIEMIYKADDCLALRFPKDGVDYVNFLTRSGLAFKGEVSSWPDGFRNCAYENSFLHIEKQHKYNILDLNTGDLLWKKPLKHWFDYLDSMSGEELSVVKIGNKKNVFSYYRGLLWKKPLSEWFDNVSGWYNDDAAIRVAKYADGAVKFNILKENGRLMFNHWLDKIEYNRNDSTYRLTINNKVNVFDISNGKILFKGPIETWPTNVYKSAVLNLYTFGINGKYNAITPSGKVLWNKPIEEWFDSIDSRGRLNLGEHNAYLKVNKDGKFNILKLFGNSNSKLVFDTWYDYLDYPLQGLCVIGEGKKHTKYNFVNKKGIPISNIWFDSIFGTFNKVGFCEVRKNGRYNMINKKGKLLLTIPIKYWPNELISTIVRDGKVYFIAKVNYETCYITRNGKLSKNPVAYCIAKTDNDY